MILVQELKTLSNLVIENNENYKNWKIQEDSDKKTTISDTSIFLNHKNNKTEAGNAIEDIEDIMNVNILIKNLKAPFEFQAKTYGEILKNLFLVLLKIY
jgi:hypothetical protein